MSLERASIAGVDNTVEHMKLFCMSQRYPFAEWGVLIGGSPKPRYPNASWMNELAETANSFKSTMGFHMNLCAHLCGKFVQDIVKGDFTFATHKTWGMYQRVQINIGSIVDQGKFDSERFIETLAFVQSKNLEKEFIIQVGEEAIYPRIIGAALDRGVKVVPIFDQSRGTGKSAANFSMPFTRCRANGYAGGLNQRNIVGKLKFLSRAVNRYPNIQYWVDMESGARTDDAIDANKVWSYLDACEGKRKEEEQVE